MMEKPTEKKAKAGDDLFTKLLILSIMLFGCCLVLYSVYMVVSHVDNLNYLVLDHVRVRLCRNMVRDLAF
jgi:hypothetical protein